MNLCVFSPGTFAGVFHCSLPKHLSSPAVRRSLVRAGFTPQVVRLDAQRPGRLRMGGRGLESPGIPTRRKSWGFTTPAVCCVVIDASSARGRIARNRLHAARSAGCHESGSSSATRARGSKPCGRVGRKPLAQSQDQSPRSTRCLFFSLCSERSETHHAQHTMYVVL